MPTGDVVDEAADGDTLGNPQMGAELLQLVAYIFFDVLEGVEGILTTIPPERCPVTGSYRLGSSL
jgi:hypothetical protein